MILVILAALRFCNIICGLNFAFGEFFPVKLLLFESIYALLLCAWPFALVFFLPSEPPYPYLLIFLSAFVRQYKKKLSIFNLITAIPKTE
jgi:hypothetical protein